MTKLIYPTLGTQVRLSADWTFPLYGEHRNQALFRALGLFESKPNARFPQYRTESYKLDVPAKNYSKPGYATVTLPAGTVLQIDRIYIRKGNSEYDSLTFFIVDSPNPVLLAWQKHTGKTTFGGGVRFWAKLDDFHRVAEGEWLVDNVPFATNPANKVLHKK